MKYFLASILALMISSPLLADPETGLFYDENFDGEGLIMLKRDDMIQFSFFSYIKRCNHRSFDGEGLIADKGYRWCRKQQAWYVTGQHPIAGGQATGPLYTANPYDDFDEDVDTLLAEVVDIGIFVLTQTPTGFDMIVLQTGNVLHPDAEIYHRTYHFSTYLFGPTHPVPVPD